MLLPQEHPQPCKSSSGPLQLTSDGGKGVEKCEFFKCVTFQCPFKALGQGGAAELLSLLPQFPQFSALHQSLRNSSAGLGLGRAAGCFWGLVCALVVLNLNLPGPSIGLGAFLGVQWYGGQSRVSFFAAAPWTTSPHP